MPSLATIDEHVSLVRTYANDVWNAGSVSLIDDIASDQVVCHGTSIGDLEGSDELAEFVEIARAAFPGLTYRVTDVSVDGDVIELRWSATGDDPSNGETDRVPADGGAEPAPVSGRAILRIADGEIAEMWSGIDPWPHWQ